MESHKGVTQKVMQQKKALLNRTAPYYARGMRTWKAAIALAWAEKLGWLI